jgi:hypothetical protein
MGPSLADPRRRFGRHADARRFLAEDGGQAASPGVWAGLLTALRYHSIQDSLASLAAWEREVLHLAFVEGRTNREIAAILSISRSTVRRRIVLGLAALDEQLRRVGTKASAVLLLLLASALARARFAGRLVGSLRATPAGNVILTTAAGAAAGAMVFGAIVANQGTAAGEHAATPSFTHVTAGAPLALSAPVPEDSTGSGGPSEVTHGKTTGTSTGATGTLDPGCDGKPTNAPATTPVGPRTANGQGLSPVTHPAAGGCGPHGVERT